MRIHPSSHFTTSAKMSATPYDAQNKSKCPVAAELTVVTNLAVQLHTLSLVTQMSSVERRAGDKRLAQLSARFDRAHAKALDLGVPLGQAFRVDLAGQGYVVTLAEDGLEYSPLS